MATITFKGSPIQTSGNLPTVGAKAPAFSLTKNDLSSISLEDYKGMKVILNIFPSVDTATCATSARKFNEQITSYQNTVVLCISKDLPFAQGRFCAAEGIERVEMLADYKTSEFETNYGLKMTEGPLESLLARSIVVIDEEGNVVYTELVSEVTEEPNYAAALAHV